MQIGEKSNGINATRNWEVQAPWHPLASSFHYDDRWRTHLSLVMECSDTRPIQPPEQGAALAFLEVGGLHHL